MLCPFLMGLAFQPRAYRLFYYLMLGWETFVLCLLGLPWASHAPHPRAPPRSSAPSAQAAVSPPERARGVRHDLISIIALHAPRDAH